MIPKEGKITPIGKQKDELYVLEGSRQSREANLII